MKLPTVSRRRLIWASLLIFAICLVAWVRLGGIPSALLDEKGQESTVLVDRHGVILYESLSKAGTRKTALAPDHLPPMLVSATVAAEDRRFWWHPGVDPVALVRALGHDLLKRRLVEGGSTISQQVAKLLIARREGRRARGLAEKLREAVLALRLEHRFSKREILALYLNLASYGNQVIGIERASEAYFGYSASMATPAQAAFLAALPQQPSRFNPYRDARPARVRQRAILNSMRRAGALTDEQLHEALNERLALARPKAPFIAPHFVDMVRATLGDANGRRIETTLDAQLQAEVEGIIENQRANLRAHGAANVAVVVLDNATGEWLAWEGSGDYYDAEHGGAINGPLAPRQPGSALKPLTYALAFEQGRTPATVLPDVPAHFPTAQPGVVYTPRNYDGQFRGPLLARRALAGSENVPAVALASEVGVPRLLRFFQRAGLSTFDRTAAYYGLGITLGNAEVKLAELVSAYAAFARGGSWIEPTVLRGGQPGRETRELLSPRAAFWVTDILSDPDAREFIFGRGGSLEFPFAVAVKTGTSQAYRDNWTIGYTRSVTVGVWVGNFDRTSLRNSSGVTGAAPIFHAVMLAAEEHVAHDASTVSDTPLAMPTSDLEEVDICALSGMPAGRACPLRLHEWLPKGEERLPCSWHHESDDGLLVVWPAEYRQWAKQHGLLQDLIPSARAVTAARPLRITRPSIEIINPPDGATYLIDPTLRREFQALPLRAVARPPGHVEWLVDNRVVGESSSDNSVMWPLAPGRHRVTARTADSRTATADIVVR